MTNEQPILEVHDERDGNRQQVELLGPNLIIGRAGAADLALASGIVSRQHAELSKDEDGRWRARDLGSRNGTVLNGRPLSEQTALEPGDVLQIGEYSLRYQGSDGQQEPNLIEATRLFDAGLSVEDGGLGEVRSLGELEAPRIAADQLETITALARELLHAAEAKERLSTLCKVLIERLFLSGTATVLSLDRDQNREVGVLAGPISQGQVEPPPFSRTLLRAVVEKETPVMAVSQGARAPRASDRVDLSFVGDQELAALACPLRSGGRRLEVLYLSVPAIFAASEWLALVSLAAEQFRLAESVWKARRVEEEKAALEKELEQAQAIQMMWVPEDFAVDGLEVSFIFEASKWVGGDYLDARRLADGRYLLAVMDVCGKGMQAALVTNGLNAIVRVLAAQALSLEAMVKALNEHLMATLPETSFVTLVMAAVDPANGTLETVNCGHPPLLVVTPTLEIRELPSGRHLPLGQFATDFTIDRETLALGELLIGYSDGVTETFDEEGRMLGLEGLRQSLASILRDDSKRGQMRAASTASEDLRVRLESRRAGGPLDDDVSLFVALRTQSTPPQVTGSNATDSRVERSSKGPDSTR